MLRLALNISNVLFFSNIKMLFGNIGCQVTYIILELDILTLKALIYTNLKY